MVSTTTGAVAAGSLLSRHLHSTQELRTLAYANQRVVYNLLFRSAAEALQELAADPRFVGGQVGAIGVLHTWKRDLGYHPHVHFLVPGGGLDFVNDCWLPTHNHFFVRVEPLSKLFRAKMRDGLKKAGLYHQIPTTAWQQDWVVPSQSVGHGETAAAYLADYLFRVGISNSRIVKLENDEVTFWYTNQQTKRRVYVTLPVFTFVDRFLHHVLPKGFVKVRYYGFLAAGNRQRLALARELLAADHCTASQTPAGIDADGYRQVGQCPWCGGVLHLVEPLRPSARCPPG
ncbi:MAG: transposase [Caldilineaceae bacterium]